jgi:hypothetical protein
VLSVPDFNIANFRKQQEGTEIERERERERDRAAAELTRSVVSLVEERIQKGGIKHTVPTEDRAQDVKKYSAN